MTTNPFLLEGKKIFITGASSGIGRSIAIECSKMGASLVITGRNQNKLLETYKSLANTSEHEHQFADLSNENELVDLVCKLPLFDGVVFCAGIVKDILTKFSDKADVENIFSINTFAPIYITQQLLHQKKIKNYGSIVFISSVSGTSCGYIGGGIYGSSKAALLGFIKGLALEVAPRQIRVNSISPGMIETDLLKSTSLTLEQITKDKENYPLKRYGSPEDVAYATIFLLADASGWMTGTNLVVDGGYTIK